MVRMSQVLNALWSFMAISLFTAATNIRSSLSLFVTLPARSEAM
jgi:hypothetical protein